jgi:hypothetical protein
MEMLSAALTFIDQRIVAARPIPNFIEPSLAVACVPDVGA